jgi:hypothetical protein
MMRLLASFAVLAALAGASPASGRDGDLYALRYGAKMSLLVPYDPVALVPSGRAIRLGTFAQAWSISPDRSRFVAAAGWRVTRGQPAALRFVDLARGRIEGTLTLPGELRRIAATAWVGGRVLAIATGSSSSTVYSIDPATRTVVRKAELDGALVLGDRSPNGVVLLLGERDRIGPATLALIDRTSRVRTVALGRITVGTEASGKGETYSAKVRRPGLALSPDGGRAYVFSAGEPAAAVDLRTLAVHYSPVRFPTAAAKRAEGQVRIAASLPDGRVVVAGYAFTAPGPTFLRIVDPADWSSRTLTRESPWFRVGGGMVFAPGARGRGLRMWTPSGSVVELFRTGSVSSVYVVGSQAFVTFFGRGVKAAVVDLEAGRVTRHAVPGHPLVASGQSIVGLG